MLPKVPHVYRVQCLIICLSSTYCQQQVTTYCLAPVTAEYNEDIEGVLVGSDCPLT